MKTLLGNFRRDVLGVVWGAMGLLSGLSLMSYHPKDPSFNSVVKMTSGQSALVSVKNLCGYFGSFLSDMLYQLLGLSAWFVAAGFFLLAYKCFRGSKKGEKNLSPLWGLFVVLISASLLSLHFPLDKFYSNTIPAGGMAGLLISGGLVSIFNSTGVAVILWAALGVFTVFLTEKSFSEIFEWIFDWVMVGIHYLFSALAATLRFSWRQLKKVAKRKPKNPEPIVSRSTVERRPMIEAKGLSFTKRFNISRPAILARKKPKPPQQRVVENWELPETDFFLDPPPTGKKVNNKEASKNAQMVEQKLAEFGVMGNVVEVIPGPAVTMYEFRPAASVKINDITKLADDLSLALSAESLRIIAPIPGRDVVGIETSNTSRSPIFMKELLEASDFWDEDIKLPIALGKSVSGEAKVIDLRKIPHLLVAGTTGSGKSVFIMSLVTSLVMRHSPKTLRMIIVDPKQVDLATFHEIPHLLLPPVKEAKPAVNTLKWLIKEMEKRYRSMSRFGSKNIEGFNQAVEELSEEEKNEHIERVSAFEDNPKTKSQSYYYESQPYIVAVIEEFADLMSVDRNGVEPTVVRLAQMARASGIHLVIAMQSPRREVLTGLIKTNFPGRISFKVASKIDSGIILDQKGAERLLSQGDMLYLAPGVSQPQRYHGPYLQDEEMNEVAQFWTDQGEPQFDEGAVASMEKSASGLDDDFGDPQPEMEDGYDEVVSFVSSQKFVSASLLQRKFRFGYPKAARFIELMESEGVVGPSNGSKPREVLVSSFE